MGNDPSKPRMATSAVAEMIQISRPQFFELRNKCLELSMKSSSNAMSRPTISRSIFFQAMEDVKMHDIDKDVFINLFDMWDKKGENRLDLLLFLSGIAPLASTLDESVKLQFAFEVFDVHQSGIISFTDAVNILGGINATASYFGDPVVQPQMIEILVEDVYQNQDELLYLQVLDLFIEHEVMRQFVSASGTMRYGGVPRS